MPIDPQTPFAPAIEAPTPLTGPVQWFVFRKRELLVFK